MNLLTIMQINPINAIFTFILNGYKFRASKKDEKVSKSSLGKSKSGLIMMSMLFYLSV